MFSFNITLKEVGTNIEDFDGAKPFKVRAHPPPVEAKDELRGTIRDRLAALDDDRRDAETRRIMERLRTLPAYREADTILVYVSVDDEVPTRDLIADLLDRGYEVCVPRVVGPSLDAVAIESLDDLTPGTYSVPEPEGGRPYDPRLIELAIVPGLAFDHDANRLGRGGGHFDAFLDEFHPPAVALAFECQIVDAVPVEDHDEPVDLVVHAFGIEGRPTP